jgi:hypothetical protein
MKNLILLASGLIFSIALQGQGQAEVQSSVNKMFIGGGAGFNSSTEKDSEDKYSQWNFGPSFVYMLNDKVGLGISFIVNGSTSNYSNDTYEAEYKSSGWMAEPFVRYYFAGIGKVKFFGDAFINFGGGKDEFSDNFTSSDESKYGNFGIGVRPGFQFWFNDNWSMASTIGNLGYSSLTDNKGDSDETKTNNFGVNVDFSTVNFSFYWHF